MPDKEVNLLDRWWKVAIFLVVLCFNVIGFYFEMQGLKEKVSKIESNFNNQIENEKTKRADRVASTDVKLEKHEKKNEELGKRVNELEQELYYIKGTLNTNKK